jgi:hypothetical protein
VGNGLTMSIPLGRYVISRGENIRGDVSRETSGAYIFRLLGRQYIAVNDVKKL